MSSSIFTYHPRSHNHHMVVQEFAPIFYFLLNPSAPTSNTTTPLPHNYHHQNCLSEEQGFDVVAGRAMRKGSYPFS